MFDGLDPDARVFLVPREDVARWADGIRPHVEKMAAGSGGRYLGSDIFAAMESGRIQLWVVVDAGVLVCVLLTELVAYPRRKALRLIGISGSRSRRWVHLLGDVEHVAAAHFGCDLMEALHQLGHERLFVTGGWRAWHVLSEKPL